MPEVARGGNGITTHEHLEARINAFERLCDVRMKANGDATALQVARFEDRLIALESRVESLNLTRAELGGMASQKSVLEANFRANMGMIFGAAGIIVGILLHFL